MVNFTSEKSVLELLEKFSHRGWLDIMVCPYILMNINLVNQRKNILNSLITQIYYKRKYTRRKKI